jgi:glycosyltransferase involved in cell wall biosynthesis
MKKPSLSKVMLRRVGLGGAKSDARIVPIPAIQKASKPLYNITVAAIIKDEGHYLEEWIEFHLGVGVDHFVLYDNGSTDNTNDVLKKYVAAGVVDLIVWPSFVVGRRAQTLAYAHALCYLGSHTNWMAFIDLDEFLFSPKFQNLNDVLGSYEDVSALVVYWVMFGTSGHLTRPKGGVLESYTQRVRDSNSVANQPLLNFKSIVQPSKVKAVLGSHSFETDLPDCVGLDENRSVVGEKHDKTHTVEILRLNHYYTRSREEFDFKVGRGSFVSEGKAPHLDTFIRKFELIESDTVEDKIIFGRNSAGQWK